MRITWGRLVVILGIVVIVLIGVFLLARGGDDAPQPVGQSRWESFPARGDLVDDQKLLDSAAQAWRDQTERDKEDERPAARIDVLYAGKASGAVLPVYSDDRHTQHDLVVLTSGTAVVTLIRLNDTSWKLLDDAPVRMSFGTTDPVIPVGSGMFLVADNRFGDSTPVIELPAELSADAEENVGVPRPFSVDFSDPLWVPDERQSGAFVIRLPGREKADFVGHVWIGGESLARSMEGRPLFTTTLGDESADDRLWKQLSNPADSAGLAAAFGVAVHSIVDPGDGTGAYRVGGGTGLTIKPLGTATLRDTPDRDRRVGALAVGIGPDAGAQVVTMGLTGENARGTEHTTAVVLGERPRGVREGIPLAAKWLRSELSPRPYLLYAADPDLDRLELRVGATKVDVDDSLGIYVPPVTADEDGPPPATFRGFDKDGVSYPAFPVKGP